MAIEHHLSKSEVQAIIQRANRERCSVTDAAEEILKLRPEVEQQYLYMGLLDGTVSGTIPHAATSAALLPIWSGLKTSWPCVVATVDFSVVLNSAGAKSEQAYPNLGSGKLQSFINVIAAS